MGDGADERPWPWWPSESDGAEEFPQQDRDAVGDSGPEPVPGSWDSAAGQPDPYQRGDASAPTAPNYGPDQPWNGSLAPYFGEYGLEPALPRRRGRRLAVAAALAGLLAASVVGGVVGHALTASHSAAASNRTTPRTGGRPGAGAGRSLTPGARSGLPIESAPGSSASAGSGSGPSDAAAIAARVDPGLVDINTTVDDGLAEAAGTGMLLTADGEVLTNNHVVDGATSISVNDVGNGETYRATVVGYSVSSDVAVLQLSGASGLQTVTSAGAAAVSVGEQVVGIGNAGGAGGTPSYAGGAITGTDQSITASDELTRSEEQLTGMIETDADIQAGDSGGPLVNDSGQVIGMDTAGSQSFQFDSLSQGTGFAIPIATATSIASQILGGHSSSLVHVGPTAFLGIQIGRANGGFGSGYGYGYGGNPDGVPVAGVVAGSPAADAGLTAGDVITSVAGYAVTSQAALQDVMVTDLSPGQVVTVQYTDTEGKQQSVTLSVASGPPA